MKKLLLLLLSALLIVCVCACESATGKNSDKPTSESTSATEDSSSSEEEIKTPSIKLPINDLQLYVGQSAKLTPRTENVEVMYFQTSDEKIATIDQSGLITAVSAGTVTISVFGSGASANLTLNVLQPDEAASISFASESVTVSFYDEVTLMPEIVNCPGPFTWASSDESVVAVDEDGMLTPKGIGTADVQINGNGKGAKIKVIIVESDTLPGVFYEYDEVDVFTGDEFAYATGVTYNGKNVYSYEVSYEMEDESIASVNENGIVTGLKNGKTQMTVNVSYRGYNFTTKVVPVTVKGDIDVRLSANGVTVYTKEISEQGYNNTATVTATVIEDGEEVEGAIVVWSSDDESIATVENGVITGVSKGQAIIYAYYTSVTGELAYAIMDVTVDNTVVDLAAMTVEAGTPDGKIAGEVELTLPEAMEGSPLSIEREDGQTHVLSEPGVVKISEIIELFGIGDKGWALGRKLGINADDKVRYTFDIDVITMAIESVEDLQKISAYGQSHPNTHNGYYVLANDIDGEGKGSVKALSVWCGNENSGFTGVFDGQGHVIKNLRLAEGYFFYGIGKAVVKNFALIDPVKEGVSRYVLASQIHHAEISNVIVKAESEFAIGAIFNYTTLTDCVFVVENGAAVVGQKDDMNGNTGSKASDLAIMVANKGEGAFAGLYATAYEVSGTYDEYKEKNNIAEYGSLKEMLTSLTAADLSAWDSLISFSSGSIYMNGQRAIAPAVNLSVTPESNEIHMGDSATFTAIDAILSIKEAVAGVTFNTATGVMTIGSGVAIGTTLTVIATSTIDPTYSEEYTLTVELVPVDLTANGRYDIELGQAHGIEAVEGDVLYIKTASGVKTELENANVITAAEFKAASGEDWSENLTVTLYTDEKAYLLSAAFITKMIRSVEDLNVIGANDTSRKQYATAYIVLANDIDGEGKAAVGGLSEWCGDENNGFRGIFDGRGHVLKNLKLADGYLFWGLGKATVKNFALVDPEQLTARNYVLASGVHHATISGVIIKAGSKWAMGANYNHTTITDSVIVLENGEAVVGQKDDTAGNTGSSASNLAIAIGKKGSGAYAGLYATAYEVGSTTYAEYKTTNNVKEYASVSALMNALKADNFIAHWAAEYISYADGSIYMGGQRAVKPLIGLTATPASNEIHAGESATFTATDATLELVEAVEGVTFNAATGELSVGESVPAGTEITIRATSSIDAGLYEEYSLTVEFVPVDLTVDGIKDIELGSAISAANVTGDVLAIKTATGNKVTLATANKVTASELNAAAGVNWSENLAVTLYTSNAAYSVNAAFVTKIIRNVADLQSISSFGEKNKTAHTGYYVLANDIDGTGQDSVKALSSDSTTSENYTTNGFRGILDGRGHILKNLRLQEGMLFWGLGKGCVVKNIALIDPVQVSARGYCFARDIMGATVTNVVIRSGATSAFLVTGCSACNATVTKCVFILTSGQFAINTAGQWGDRQTAISDLAIVVGNPTAGTLGNGAESFAGLIGTHYVAGSYSTYKADNNINEYTTTGAMLTALGSDNYISAWDSEYISYADGKLYFNGTVVLE